MEFKKQKARIQEIEKILNHQPTQNPDDSQERIHEQKEVKMGKIKVERLPYSYSALERFIDAETMKVHYNQHYKGYVNKLNKALEKIKDKDMNLENIIKGISRYNRTIRNNAGGAYNHQLFWNMLSPKKQRPTGPVYDKITKKFGSYDNFKKEFAKKAKSQFGSGWVWLVLTKSGDLKVMTTQNQDNPLMGVIKNGGHPLLGLDLWEHAYYLKYRSKRDDYINNFFSVINWSYVNRLFDQKNKSKINESRNAKDIITEGISAGCSPKQVNTYRMIFNRNPQVKKKFMYTIMDILKEVYSEFWYDKGEYAEGQMSGIYDFEQPGRSVINKLNTNYSAFCIIVNDINKVLKHYGQDPLNFVGKDNKGQMYELSKMLKFLIEFRYRIFNQDSGTFKAIMASLDKSNKFGDERELKAVINMKDIFGTKKVFKVGELGGKDDMLGGVDATVEQDGQTKTIQIKPFNGFEENEGVVTVFGTGNVKPYSTNYLVFHNDKKGTLVFSNDKTEIQNGRFTFPKESWINPQ
jgi:Fe-Mn family superoxide dismutase